MNKILLILSLVVFSSAQAVVINPSDKKTIPTSTSNPPSKVMNTPITTTAPSMNADKNIVEIALSDPTFSTLVTALTTADLVTTLEGPGPFTVFAPTNEAFKKLSPEKLKNLMKPENKSKLASILTFHVVPGKISAADIKSGKIKTVNGKQLDVRVQGSDISVNGAKVLKADIPASNGTVYVVDTVLLP